MLRKIQQATLRSDWFKHTLWSVVFCWPYGDPAPKVEHVEPGNLEVELDKSYRELVRAAKSLGYKHTSFKQFFHRVKWCIQVAHQIEYIEREIEKY